MSAICRFLLIFLGAGLGGNARFCLATWVQARSTSPFPWGTLVVNVSGGLIMGAFFSWFIRSNPGPNWQLFVATGLLGGYTTFSAFSLETVQLVEKGLMGMALANMLASTLLSFVSCYLGFVGVKAILG